MDRITMRDIEGAVRGLNVIAGFSPDEADAPTYSRDEATGENRAMVGRYIVAGAYGGLQLQQIVNEGGGVRGITTGYVSKRELYYRIHAYREGMAAGRDGDPYTLAALRAAIPAERERRARERAAWAARS